MNYVILHPRRGVYIGYQFSQATGKQEPRFSWAKARTDAVKVFDSAKEAQKQIDKMSAHKSNLRRCYPVPKIDLERKIS